MVLFGFCGSCGELQSWLANQTGLYRTLPPQATTWRSCSSSRRYSPLGAGAGGLSCLALLPLFIPALFPPHHASASPLSTLSAPC